MHRLAAFLILLPITGCTRTQQPTASLALQVAEAHAGDLLHLPDAIAAVVHLEIPNPTRFFDARFTHHLRDGRTRMLLADETILVWDGNAAWMAPRSAQVNNPHGKLSIWPLLVTFPFKLNQPHAQLSEPQPIKMAGADYLLAEFSAGGDDRFTLYLDPKSKLIRHLVIPAHRAAQIDPSFDRPLAISFYNFQSIEGAQFPETWRLWAWNNEDGIHGGPLGEVRLYNVEFLTPKPGAFTPPPNAQKK